jgi:hypothetical protein
MVMDRKARDGALMPAPSARHLRLILRVSVLAWGGLGSTLALAQASVEPEREEGMQHVGRVHDRLRASRERERQSLQDQLNKDLYAPWAQLKKSMNRDLHVEFSMDASIMGQWGSNGAGQPAFQTLYTPSVNWTAFKDTPIGTGAFQFFYTKSQYWSSQNASKMQYGMNINTPINDFPTNSYAFAQLSYTHTFPGDWIAVTVGQFPMYNFDGNAYAANQQVNFINYSLSQNGSSTYPVASLGGYVQINPTKEIAFVVGFQDANNISGNHIQTSTFGDGQYNWFAYGAWSSKLADIGQTQIALLYYNQPSVVDQPQATQGWSFSASQAIGEQWGVFLRANTASSGSAWNIKSSVAAGGVYNNPLGRSKLDQIGLGAAWNKTNTDLYVGQNVRDSEWVVETYWAWTVFKGLQVTPDVQLIIKPALKPSEDYAGVFSLRLTGLF